MSAKKKALGRGLSALLENTDTDITSGFGSSKHEVVGGVADIKIENIDSNPFQPRTHFDHVALEELAGSIKLNGLIQPITVRKMGFGRYQLISGERRLKAAALAGLTQVPAYIRIANDRSMLELALIENIQREDLDPIEIAISYQRLIDECRLTHDALSRKVNKRRSTVTNYLRLLQLPAEIQKGLRERKIAMGHARALITVKEADLQIALFEETVEHDLSVRQVENLVRANASLMHKTTRKRNRHVTDPTLSKISKSLSAFIHHKVDIKGKHNGSGKMIIHFSSKEDMEDIISKLKK